MFVKIEILGSGCPKCKQTERVMNKAVKELNLDAEIVKVMDISEIMERGVVATPAVSVDGNIVISGKVPKVEEAKKLLINLRL
ncbi:MAG: thioredoxin family protein [Kosmotogaceae bacterium]